MDFNADIWLVESFVGHLVYSSHKCLISKNVGINAGQKYQFQLNNHDAMSLTVNINGLKTLCIT